MQWSTRCAWSVIPIQKRDEKQHETDAFSESENLGSPRRKNCDEDRYRNTNREDKQADGRQAQHTERDNAACGKPGNKPEPRCPESGCIHLIRRWQGQSPAEDSPCQRLALLWIRVAPGHNRRRVLA